MEQTMIRGWLESLVGCNCDNGEISDPTAVGFGYACPRCVKVQVGGITLRARQDALTRYPDLGEVKVILDGVEA